MNFSDEFFDPESNSFLDDEKLKSKVQKCKEYVSNGQTIAYLGNIEDTIQLCLEYDFIEDGIFLTDAALEISPYSSELWHSKGIFYNNLFEFEKAFVCFQKALSLNPSDVETMINKSIAEDNLGLWDEAISTLENAQILEPNNEEILFNLGVFYQRKNYFELASEYFLKTLDIDSEYSDAWYELGFCYESINKYDQALDAYKKFLDIEPYNAGGWYNMGIIYLRKENYEKAINSFELSTSINDDFANAWYNCGIGYNKLNRFIDARNAFIKSYELDPFDDSIPLNIAQTFEATGDYNKAFEYFEETLKVSKSNVDAYVGLGNYFARKNDREKMINYFSKIIKYTIYNNYSEFSKEELLQNLNNTYAEITELTKATSNIDDLFRFAELHFQLGNWEESISVYNTISKIKSETSNSYYGIALALFMLNRNEEGLEFLIKSFELNSGNEFTFLDEFPNFEATQLYIRLTDSI